MHTHAAETYTYMHKRIFQIHADTLQDSQDTFRYMQMLANIDRICTVLSCMYVCMYVLLCEMYVV
jgi:hypothetical protein